VPEGQQPTYTADMCPRTLDLLSRALLFDIDYTLTDEECDLIAGAINKVLRAVIA
jgi:hypothetical protein